MGGGSPRENGHPRSACTECQRRKQKCNREWPCNHCQKRKVADKCCFVPSLSSPDSGSSLHDATGRKRQLSQDDLPDASDHSPWDDGSSGFEALGYTPSHLFSGLSQPKRNLKAKEKQNQQYYVSAHSCSQLKRALQLLPPRPYTDSLVQNFLNHVNYHYYIIHPPSFLDEYRRWWVMRSESSPLGLQWTCLLLVVCACSAQYTDVELQRKLEADLGESTQKLADKYHSAARELHSVIPVGNSHLLNVQSLLHSCYWYKSEARFVESWHVLSAAIREAQELGIHQEAVFGPMSEFEREMRRRVWCVLDTWDWQTSALLSRPMIIDRTDCHVGLPSLKLEGYTPSPLLHMKLQSELIGQLSKRFGIPKNVVSPDDVQEYMAILQAWMRNFPATYDMDSPDRSSDIQRPWIVLHRHYLHTMSHSMLLDPIRAYLARTMTMASPIQELQIRSDGVDYALRLMGCLYGFFNHVYPRDAKFHFVLFCIFDTAALLCSALMHDQDGSMPRRQDISAAIDGALAMLRRLSKVTKTARKSYEMLVRVSQRVRGPGPTAGFSPPGGKRPRLPLDLAMTPPSMNQAELASARDLAPDGSLAGPPTGLVPAAGPTGLDGSTSHPAVLASAGPPSLAADASSAPLFAAPNAGLAGLAGPPMLPPGPQVGMTPPTDDMYQMIELGNISQQDLGDLANLWDYGSLNLGFVG